MSSNTRSLARWIVVGFCCLGLIVGVVRISNAQDGRALQDKFREVDLDGDGHIVPDELPNEQLFKKLDGDSDGKVTMEEARKAFRSGVLTKEMIQPAANPPAPVPDSMETSSPKQSAEEIEAGRTWSRSICGRLRIHGHLRNQT